jgi:hypothetical protein
LEACEADAIPERCELATRLSGSATQEEVARIKSAREARLEKERRVREANARSLELIPHAEACAKSQIYKKLRSPSTASFGAELVERNSDRFCYAFKVDVDAQNGFGAYLRKSYCVMVQLVEPWNESPKYRGFEHELGQFSALGLSEDSVMQNVCNFSPDNAIGEAVCKPLP